MPPRIFDGMYEGWRRATLVWLGQVCALIALGMFALALLRLGEWHAADSEVWIFCTVGIVGLVGSLVLIIGAGGKS